MPTNATATRQAARQAWKECTKIHGGIRRLTFAAGAPAVLTADLAHNLTLIQAYAALGVALLYKLEKPLNNRTPLKRLMNEYSRIKGVHWPKYTLIDKGREKRNDVAHRGEWLKRAEVFGYAEAIQEELIAMGIVDRCDSYQFDR